MALCDPVSTKFYIYIERDILTKKCHWKLNFVPLDSLFLMGALENEEGNSPRILTIRTLQKSHP